MRRGLQLLSNPSPAEGSTLSPGWPSRHTRQLSRRGESIHDNQVHVKQSSHVSAAAQDWPEMAPSACDLSCLR